MAKITQPISAQRFEAIRDRIAYILADELASQAILQDDELLNATVWLERFVPFDKTEIPALKVYYVGTPYEAHTPITNRGKHQYNIDIYTKGKNSSLQMGDNKSALSLHKLIGNCLAILQSPFYIKLDFAAGYGIENRHVTNVAIAEPEDKGDSIHTYTGRISFTVTAVEQFEGIQPTEIDEYYSKFKIDITDKGHQIITTNN